VTTAQYEAFATQLYEKVMSDIKTKFQNLEILSIDGASAMGIDKPLIETRLANTSMRGLSFSCPEYMQHVDDDSRNSIYVAHDIDTYLRHYALCIDTMICVG
jgi:hypothetical protein